jgi:hypothetical protein
MFNIHHAANTDKTFWFTHDEELSEKEFDLKIRDKRAYIICDDEKPIGIMRYNLCWDIIPFLTLIHIDELYRGKSFVMKRDFESFARGFHVRKFQKYICLFQ